MLVKCNSELCLSTNGLDFEKKKGMKMGGIFELVKMKRLADAMKMKEVEDESN